MNVFATTSTSTGFDLATLFVGEGQRSVAGIGSRETPDLVFAFMTDAMRAFAQRGWVLRSGGAPGADQACEAGYSEHRSLTEIFLPWKGFEGSKSRLYPPYLSDADLDAAIARARPGWEPKMLTGRESPTEIVANAYLFGEHFHPRWDRVSSGARKLQSRNGHQVLGEKLNDPSTLVVAWTVDGEATGGTGQAIRFAEEFGIPVVNLKRRRDLEALIAVLGLTGWDVEALLSAPPVKRQTQR